MIDQLPSRIVAKIRFDTDTGCWIWTGFLNGKGYGKVWWDGGMRRTHRVVYQLLVGPILDGLDLDHVYERGCRSRACCRPDHLEPVTRRVNMLRSPLVGAKDRCKRGHLFSEANTMLLITRSNGFPRRECRTCHNDRNRAYYRSARQRQAAS